MFSLVTSEDVLAETEYTLRRRFPEAPGRVIVDRRAKIVRYMDSILKDYDGSVAYNGSDPNDRHVHAAALASDADILLTQDRNFESDDDEFYEVYRADDFFVLVDDSALLSVQHVTAMQRAYWADRGGKSIVTALQEADCPQFADRVNQHLRTLSGVPRDDLASARSPQN